MGEGRGVHLCGSVPLTDARTVFSEAARRIGPHLKRIPDGETGIRDNWVVWQLPKMQAHPDLETVPPPSPEYGPSERVQPKPGVDAASIDFGPLGYAEAALESWQVFRQLREDGTIPAGVRFQVSLPTPIAVIGAFVAGPQGELERRYEARLLDELAAIVAAIPAEDLAVQWDAAVEFAIFEGIFPSWFGSDYRTQLDEVGQRLVRLGAAVPEAVELGYHLCYGDFGHRHFAEPTDTSRLAAVAARIVAGLDRPVNWLHLPVPRSRTDTDYFKPLADLVLAPETDLYLGLVHATDGRAGALERIEAARSAVAAFGIATECGMGRRPADQIPALFDLHAELAEILA
ncbi:hypothetical protein NG2371_05498 [Nocardia gamkensis]|uniref:Uncharacterized protein n=1 Tax=Nocardia gamkensis TaxID=352869 RepID=A0A7X6R6I3_9NOCA|nr:hypothetical protein [Nocardia gamkensis]NKY30594.1 hypothetical protein [Nocardia gamkensis]NQE71027.1 hypothetical protein [Nocardia gamkensis]